MHYSIVCWGMVHLRSMYRTSREFRAHSQLLPTLCLLQCSKIRLSYTSISFQCFRGRCPMEHFIWSAGWWSWTHPREQSFRRSVCHLYHLGERRFTWSLTRVGLLGSCGIAMRCALCTFRVQDCYSSLIRNDEKCWEEETTSWISKSHSSFHKTATLATNPWNPLFPQCHSSNCSSLRLRD